jgi:hypothetical protein
MFFKSRKRFKIGTYYIDERSRLRILWLDEICEKSILKFNFCKFMMDNKIITSSSVVLFDKQTKYTVKGDCIVNYIQSI